MKWQLLFILPLFVILNSLLAGPALADWPDDCTLDSPICSVNLPPGGSLLTCFSRSPSNLCTPTGSSVRNGNWCCPAVIPTPTPTSVPTCPYSCISNLYNCTAEGGTLSPGFCRTGYTCCNFPPLPPGATPPPGYTPPGTYPPQTPQGRNFNPLKYPCDQTSSPEFHPLRPYPASPCDPLIPEKNHTSFTCGKSLNVQGNFEFPSSVDVASLANFDENTAVPGTLYKCDPLCDPTIPGTVCDVCAIKRVGFNVRIDLSPAELPIIGNTQDPMDDATKVNNYLNWYLNGTVQQSEQTPLDPNNLTDMDRLINFAGPIKKLLPQSLRDKIAETLKFGPPNAYHNYLVDKSTRLRDVLPDLFKNVPLSTLEDITGEVTLGLIPDQQPGNPINSSSLPGYQTGDLALSDNPNYFQKGLVYAITDPANPNAITLTIQPDTYTAPPAGQSAAGTDSRLYFPQLRQTNVLLKLLSAMFRPKSAGSAKPADPEFLINRDYNPQSKSPDFTTVRDEYGDPKNNSSVVPGFPAPKPLFDYHGYDQRCDLTEVGINPGDSLSASQVTAHLAYTQKFQYTPIVRTGTCNVPYASCDPTDALPNHGCCTAYLCDDLCTHGQCPPGTPPQDFRCIGTVPTNPDLPTEARAGIFAKVPLLDEIYDDMVWGYNSIFNRFFFKRGPWEEPRPGGRDIPGAAGVVYSGNPAIDATHQDTPDTPSVSSGKQSSIAQIYFGHLGSMVEYFLGAGQDNKNLQRLLRPKDFGGFGLVTTPVPTTINCNQSAPPPPPAIASQLLSRDILAQTNTLAQASGNLCSGNQVTQCYNDLLAQNGTAYDPAFPMSIWVEESCASDYTLVSSGVADFGCVRVARNNFQAQLSCFLSLKNQYMTDLFKGCRANPSQLTVEDLLLIFSEGFRACNNPTTGQPNDPYCYRKFCSNPQFPNRIQKAFSIISKGRTLDLDQVIAP